MHLFFFLNLGLNQPFQPIRPNSTQISPSQSRVSTNRLKKSENHVAQRSRTCRQWRPSSVALSRRVGHGCGTSGAASVLHRPLSITHLNWLSRANLNWNRPSLTLIILKLFPIFQTDLSKFVAALKFIYRDVRNFPMILIEYCGGQLTPELLFRLRGLGLWPNNPFRGRERIRGLSDKKR